LLRKYTLELPLLILAQQVADRMVEEGTSGGAAAWGSQSPDRDAVVLPAIALMRSYGWNLDLDSLVVLVI